MFGLTKFRIAAVAIGILVCAASAAATTKTAAPDLSVAIETAKFQLPLNPAPIDKSWIIEGEPVASNAVVSTSADRSTYTIVWECTKGKFNYYYDFDETLMIIEGSVVIDTDHTGPKRYGPGDIITFKKGGKAVWQVEQTIRKIAFCRKPQHYLLSLLTRAVAKLERALGGQGSVLGAPSA